MRILTVTLFAVAICLLGSAPASAGPMNPGFGYDYGCLDSAPAADYIAAESGSTFPHCDNFATAVQTATASLGLLPTLSGTTGSIGGSLLVATCTSGTVTITGAAVGMVATTNPTTYPGVNIQWQAYVSAANTVTVNVCTSGLTLTPTATTYRVRVTQ
jgi:hypothetical protein